jgi:hypothetical protein
MRWKMKKKGKANKKKKSSVKQAQKQLDERDTQVKNKLHRK